MGRRYLEIRCGLLELDNNIQKKLLSKRKQLFPVGASCLLFLFVAISNAHTMQVS